MRAGLSYFDSEVRGKMSKYRYTLKCSSAFQADDIHKTFQSAGFPSQRYGNTVLVSDKNERQMNKLFAELISAFCALAHIRRLDA